MSAKPSKSVSPSEAFIPEKQNIFRELLNAFLFRSKKNDHVLQAVSAYRSQFSNTATFVQDKKTVNIHEALFLAEQNVQRANNARKPSIFNRIGSLLGISFLKRSPKKQAELNKKYQDSVSKVQSLAANISQQFQSQTQPQPSGRSDEALQKVLDSVKTVLDDRSKKLEKTQKNQIEIRSIGANIVRKVDAAASRLKAVDAEFSRQIEDPLHQIQNQIQKMMDTNPPTSLQEIQALRERLADVQTQLQPSSPTLQAFLRSTRENVQVVENLSDEYRSQAEKLAARDPGLKKTGVESFQDVRVSTDSMVKKTVQKTLESGVTSEKVESVTEKLESCLHKLNELEAGVHRQAELKSQAESNAMAYRDVYPSAPGAPKSPMEPLSGSGRGVEKGDPLASSHGAASGASASAAMGAWPPVSPSQAASLPQKDMGSRVQPD